MPLNYSIIPPYVQPTRHKNPPSYLKDYICNSFIGAPNHSCYSKTYPLYHFISYSQLSLLHSHSFLSPNTLTKPKSFTETNKFECWKQAMQTEITTLERIGTWDIVDLPPNFKPINSK